MIDVDRLAQAHYKVQRDRAQRAFDAILARNEKPGATDHYIRTTPWEDLPTALQDVRRAIAQDLVDAYEGLS